MSINSQSSYLLPSPLPLSLGYYRHRNMSGFVVVAFLLSLHRDGVYMATASADEDIPTTLRHLGAANMGQRSGSHSSLNPAKPIDHHHYVDHHA